MSHEHDLPDGPAHELAHLVALVRRLRRSDGCPWDQKQTLGSVRAYLLEESHELAAAIDQQDFDDMQEELGDLLFQTAFIACLAEEEGRFGAADAVRGIYDKMIDRHPHVFGETGPLETEKEVLAAWEAAKTKDGERSVLAGVPASLPALTGAYRLTQKAAGVGFDWPDVDGVTRKIREELGEVDEVLAEVDDGARKARLEEELGDLLFSVANLARHLDIDPEGALAKGNLKFRRRFEALEEIFKSRRLSLTEADLETMDAVWDEVKTAEKSTEK